LPVGFVEISRGSLNDFGKELVRVRIFVLHMDDRRQQLIDRRGTIVSEICAGVIAFSHGRYRVRQPQREDDRDDEEAQREGPDAPRDVASRGGSFINPPHQGAGGNRHVT